ncbi:MAG TPA: hypothetical protein VF771_13815 [Longimicrobiaceae bacterium]
MTPEHPAPRRPAFTALGRQGIALPLALLGLVVVTLLVTTVLLSSSTEFAVSTGQRDASRSLYTADGALQQYVSNRAVALPANQRFLEGTDALTYQGVPYTLSLARLSRTVTGPAGGAQTATEAWSIIASPTARGRAVGTLLRVTRQVTGLTLNVTAGATSGGDVTIGGNATISNGRTGQTGCANGDTAHASIQVTAGSAINVNGTSVMLEGKADTMTTQKSKLMETVLGKNMNLDSLAKYANIKFGPMFNKPDWPNGQQKNPNQDWPLTTADSVFNWGCPPADAATTNTFTCTDAGAQRFVVVAIDASNLGNNGIKDNVVTLNGDYGQGILIVLRGSLNIQGNFVFRGIILVEKDLQIGGGSGQFAGKIEGTVVAFGDRSQVADTYDGTATIRYNQCSITDAQNALNRQKLDEQPQNLAARTFAWFEVVR